MVDFTLTDEQRSMREMAHDFAEKEIRPVAWEYDKEGTWPGDVLEKAWELGLMNGHLPSEYGGPGLGYLDGCLIEEEIAWAARASEPRCPVTGSPPRRSRWRPQTSSRRSTSGACPRRRCWPLSA